MSEKRVLSIFSGGGGLDIGFHQAGFKIVACVEIDSASCETLKLNKGRHLADDCLIFNEDITKLDPQSLDIGKIDFIIGGPPCQSFSAAGRRAGGVTGINDTRGSLFWYYCKFLEHFKPKGFLFENVRGILQANNSNAWKIIQESFSGIGYNLTHRILDAADYGIPQHRERVILVGSRNKMCKGFKFPRPTHGPDSTDNRPHVTVGEAFLDIDNPEEIVPPYGGKYGDLLPDIPPGMNYLFYTERMGHPNPRFAWRSKFSGFLYKADPNGVSKTLVAHQGRYDGPFHWKNRKLNFQEIKRLQGFPDEYQFIKSKTESLKQIGNSVSPKFAFMLAKSVMNQFFNGKFELEYINENEKLKFDSAKGEKAQRTRSGLAPSIKNTHQLNLFSTRKELCRHAQFSDKIIYERGISYSRSFELIKGVWNIKMRKSDASETGKETVCLTLNFHSAINDTFNKIIATIESETCWDINKLWDSIHYCVSQNTSYENLQPLFGHFTEPYPQFDLITKIYDDTDQDIANWILKLDNFNFLGKLQQLAILTPNLVNIDNQIKFIKKLRHHGYDIRVNETNRAIPEGLFKACYPFTLYSKDKTYTVWSERGTHKTGDLKLTKTAKGYKPVLVR